MKKEYKSPIVKEVELRAVRLICISPDIDEITDIGFDPTENIWSMD